MRNRARSLALFMPSTPGAPTAPSASPTRRRRGPSSFSSSASSRRRKPRPHASPRRPGAAGDRRRRRGADGCSSTTRIRFRCGSRCACPICRRLAVRLIQSAVSASKTWCHRDRSSHRIQRQDVVMSDLSDDRAYAVSGLKIWCRRARSRTASSARTWCSPISRRSRYWTRPIEVPALSFVTMPAADVLPDTGPLTAKGGILSKRAVSRARREGRRPRLAQARTASSMPATLREFSDRRSGSRASRGRHPRCDLRADRG